MAELLALGVSHKTAPLELRERMALTEGRAVGILGELLERAEVLEAAAISTCNRTELFIYASDPVGAEAAALGLLSREAETQPTELVDHLYSLRAADRGRAPAAGDGRARLDDHRRGRDPGPDQARLRARPGRGRHRADPQPPLPRGARRGQAGAHGDRDLGALDVDPLGRGRARPADARRARGPADAGRRRRRDGRADGAGARRQGRAGDLHRQPPLRPCDRPRPALRRPRGPLRGAARGAHRRRHRRHLDLLAAPRDRARGTRRGDDRAGRAAAAADRPRGSARHPPLVPRDRRGQPLRHGRPAIAGRAQRLRPRGRGTPRRGASCGRSSPASTAGSPPRT